MKKRRGFTLIELMVVMAIIAILATAGLSAYTGYIKKARDTTRIADLAALNAIVLWSLSMSGNPPNETNFTSLVTSMNNGVMITDPLNTKNVCYYTNSSGSPVTTLCQYEYFDDDPGGSSYYCNSGEYMLKAYFESTGNSWLYKTSLYAGDSGAKYYWIGNCTLLTGSG